MRRSSRVLVVQTAFLGDIVLTTPLLRELRRALPGAHLTVLTTAAGAEALAGFPGVDAVRPYDKSWRHTGLRASADLVGFLRRGRFDIAVAAHRSVRTGLLLLLSGAKERVGFAGAPGAFAYGHRVPWVAGQHAVRRYVDLARPLGGEPQHADLGPHLAVDALARQRVLTLLREEGIGDGDATLCIAPGSVWGAKRWVPEGFAGVVEKAGARGLAPLLIGSPGERELCLRVAELARRPVPVLAGRTGIRELVALVERSSALIANDSGAAHVASAVGTPVVCVFGPTVPAQGYAPFGSRTRIVEHADLDCRPCHRHGPRRCPLGHFRCMREIDARQVLERLDELLVERRAAPALLQLRGAAAPG